jgi:hypothetical protein
MNNEHKLWRELYEAAAREPDLRLRLRRITKAQHAILAHALVLELTRGSDEECTELEQAADGLRLMKLAYQSAENSLLVQ